MFEHETQAESQLLHRPEDSRSGFPVVHLCLVKTKSTFEINNLKKRDVTMLHAIWLGEITIRHGQDRLHTRMPQGLNESRETYPRPRAIDQGSRPELALDRWERSG